MPRFEIRQSSDVRIVHCRFGKRGDRRLGVFRFFAPVVVWLGLVHGISSWAALIPDAGPQAGQDREAAFLRMFFEEEALVESATRHPKPISQVAENVTLVTAQEIEAMNAHTVAEVLNRVPGVFVDFLDQDFASRSLLSIQGSREEHVTVLVDGVPWNFLGGGNASVETIPVGVVERIEIIKGSASSTWGSALGGVINIITKAPAPALVAGLISESYGQSATIDVRAQFSGTGGRAGYYLFGGKQSSDGLQDVEQVDISSVFSKLQVAATERLDASFTVGYSKSDQDSGRLPSQFALAENVLEALLIRGSVDANLSPELSFHLTGYAYQQRLTQEASEDGTFAPVGDLLQKNTFDEENYGIQSRVVWTPGGHTVVAGLDYAHGCLDQRNEFGDLFRSLGAPSEQETNPDLDRWGIYANDTFSLGQWTFTPGVRFDDNSQTRSFVSPSLGLTRPFGATTLLRGSIARGFSIPPLAELSGGGVFFDPNPDLDPEEVWSFQVGVESAALRWVWSKVTLFRHEIRDERVQVDSDVTPGNLTTDNRGNGSRTGFEIEFETAPMYNVTLRAGGAYVDVERSDLRDLEQYTADVGIFYDDGGSWHAQLFGHFVWWDLGPGSNEGDRNDFIWDFNIRRRFRTEGGTEVDLFFTAHNLFNGDQFQDDDFENPDRWFEGGFRIRF